MVVRTDQRLDGSINSASAWRDGGFSPRLFTKIETERIPRSFSGGERNRLFLNRQGKFVDVSGLSGLDSPADGRSSGILDLDHDGLPDIACINSNTPRLEIFRNQTGPSSSAGRPGNAIALRFVGANHTAAASNSASNRDGYGAMVTVTAGALRLIREHRCGEGRASQNSPTMLVGIGAAATANVAMRWPSGKTQQVEDVPAGSLVTLDEKSGKAETVKYRPVRLPPERDSAAGDRRLALPAVSAKGAPAQAGDAPKLVVYTTMATWCPACKKHLPQLQWLRTATDKKSLAMYGIPIDPKDSQAMLEDYVKRHRPAYELRTDLTDDQRSQVGRIIRDVLKSEALPASIVTDRGGRVLLTTAGIPTVSQLRRLAGTLANGS